MVLCCFLRGGGGSRAFLITVTARICNSSLIRIRAYLEELSRFQHIIEV